MIVIGPQQDSQGQAERSQWQDTKKGPQALFTDKAGLSECAGIFEQTDFQITGSIDEFAIYKNFTICNAHHQLTVDNALEMNFIGHFLRGR